MASTLLNEQGWNRDAIERQLAHAERDGVWPAYSGATTWVATARSAASCRSSWTACGERAVCAAWRRKAEAGRSCELQAGAELDDAIPF